MDKDKSFYDYLDRIGQYFFNLKPKKVEKESMFNNLMRMLTTTQSPNTNQQANNNPTSSSDNNNTNEDDEDDEEDWNSFKEEDIADNDLLD